MIFADKKNSVLAEITFQKEVLEIFKYSLLLFILFSQKKHPVDTLANSKECLEKIIKLKMNL